MVWPTIPLAAVLALSFCTTAVEGGTDCLTSEKCAAGRTRANFAFCGLTDSDITALGECFDSIGRSGIEMIALGRNELTMFPSELFDSLDGLTNLYVDSNKIGKLEVGIFDNMADLLYLSLNNNLLETLPANVFAEMASLKELTLNKNLLKTVPANVFADLASLKILDLEGNNLDSLPADAFVGLSAARAVILSDNELTTLPEGIFKDLGAGELSSLHLDGNSGLQCVPVVTVTNEWDTDYYGYRYIEELPTIVGSCECTPSDAVTCGSGTTCSPGRFGYTCDACPAGSSTCGDPHMQGLRGQTIDWSGVDGGWYCLVTDDDPNLQVNVRLTAPLPESFPDRQLITGLSVGSEGHSLVIEVVNPYTVDTSGCPRGISPCLADGGLRAIVDGEEVEDLLRFSRHEYASEGIAVSASNLPVECRQFGGDRIWTRMYDEMLQGERQLLFEESFEDWILRFDNMAAPDWCTQYIENHDLADLQSNHAIFKIEAAGVTIRLNVGTNYQGGGELDWDGRVLPGLEFWQMDVGVHGLSLDSESLSGILGETARPVLGEDGEEVMKGYEAFRGTVEDYRVSDSLGTDFDLLDQH